MLLGKLERTGRLNVAMKNLGYSPNITQEFLRELKAHVQCSTSHASCMDELNVLRCYHKSVYTCNGVWRKWGFTSVFTKEIFNT